MFFRIIKKDLKRKKVMNVILFLFLVIATMFLAASLKNMKVILNAIDYFSEITNATDYYEIASDYEGIKKAIEESNSTIDYTIQPMLATEKDGILVNGIPIGIGQSLISTCETKFNLVVDDNNQVVSEIPKGSIGISSYFAKKNDLKLKDEITIQVEGQTRTFAISHIVKDFVFGSQYVSAKRFLIHTDDFQSLFEHANSSITYFASINTSNVEEVAKSLSKGGVDSYFGMDHDTLKKVFLMDLLVMGILIVVSVILILIAFVVLRFTILFTIQEDYKEIGVMKAIGLKDRSIRKVYLLKYICLSICGALVGAILSFGFGELLLGQFTQNMVMEKSTTLWWIEALCGIVVVLLVSTYSILCMNKLRKFSAMKAIRSGESGERYTRKSPITLHKRKKMPLQLYLAINDLLSSPKRYLSLLLVFMLGIILVNIGDNSATTLGDESIAMQLGYQRSDFAIQTDQMSAMLKMTEKEVAEELNQVKQRYQDHGIDVSLFLDFYVQANVVTKNNPDGLQLFVSCLLNNDCEGYLYTKGVAPRLENECAVTELTMEKLGVVIGDTIEITVNGTTNQYLITATYQSMANMGSGIRVSEHAPIDYKGVSFVSYIQGDFMKEVEFDATLQRMKEITPEYNVLSFAELSRKELGMVADTVATVKDFFLIISIVINILISILMVKTFFTKDRASMALYLSLGVRKHTLRAWQTLRIVIVFVLAMFLGCFLSYLLDPLCAKLTFGMMGAKNVILVREPIRVYLLYPLGMTVITAVITYLCTSSVKKIQFQEINSME